MATATKVIFLILCFALVCNYVDANPRVRPESGPDIYKGKNVAKDTLAPGEKVVNVMSFGAKGDGKFDCTQVVNLLYIRLYILANFNEKNKKNKKWLN
jgi:galacturan 1,4-alpha-galacturonidase